MAERTKWDLIAERKRLRRERSNMQGLQLAHLYRTCGLCGMQYCANNYQDGKTRVKRWKGIEICAHCRFYVIPRIRDLMDRKVLKFTKKYRDEPR